MEGLWAALGRISIDSGFLNGVLGRSDATPLPPDQDPKEFTDRVNDLPKQRLSRFEMFELLRLLKFQEVIDAAVELGKLLLAKRPNPSDELLKIYGLLCIDPGLRRELINSNDPDLKVLRARRHFDLAQNESGALFDLLTERDPGQQDSAAARNMDRIHMFWSGSCAPALLFAAGYRHGGLGVVRDRR